MLEGHRVNELDALENDDLIPADNAGSCHSSADEPEPLPDAGGGFSIVRASAHPAVVPERGSVATVRCGWYDARSSRGV